LKRSSTTTVYFIGYAKGLLNNPINTDSVDEVLYTRSNFDSNNNLIYSITTDYLNTNGTDYKIIHSGNSSVGEKRISCQDQNAGTGCEVVHPRNLPAIVFP
jgi:hypothetical protein